jgi:hypothetical protein
MSTHDIRLNFRLYQPNFRLIAKIRRPGGNQGDQLLGGHKKPAPKFRDLFRIRPVMDFPGKGGMW